MTNRKCEKNVFVEKIINYIVESIIITLHAQIIVKN